MKVVVDGEESDSVTVDSGVPQGKVLGPLLFLCHINDLPDAVKSTVRLFADNCLIPQHQKQRRPSCSGKGPPTAKDMGPYMGNAF